MFYYQPVGGGLAIAGTYSAQSGQGHFEIVQGVVSIAVRPEQTRKLFQGNFGTTKGDDRLE